MNVLLIIADALRRDHMGCYGYGKNTTPTIDRLVREGILFKDCASVSSHTVPPTLSIISGVDPINHGVMTAQDYGVWIKEKPWKDKRVPLRVLAEQGYAVDGELVMRWGETGFQHDCNDFMAYLDENRNRKWFYCAQPYPTHLPYDPPQAYYEEFIDVGYCPGAASRERLDVVKKTMVCHPTGLVPALDTDQEENIPDEDMDEDHARTSGAVDFEPEDTPGVRALYDGEMRVLDDWVGERLEKLRSLDLLDDTLIILMSDHGEELLERGHVGHSSANLMGTLYDESLMVPLIMWHASALPKGRAVKGLVSVMDVMPTVFEILGLDLAEPAEGKSLLPLVRGGSGNPHEEIFAEVPPAGWQRLIGDERRIRIVRTGDWKLICNLDLATGDRKFELYDLQSDPGERNNMYDPAHKQANVLREKLESHYR